LLQAYPHSSCGRRLRPDVARSSDDTGDLVENLDRAVLKHGDVFEDDFIDSFIDLKVTEVERLEMPPHRVEFEMYYSQ
jgi:glutamine synthetase